MAKEKGKKEKGKKEKGKLSKEERLAQEMDNTKEFSAKGYEPQANRFAMMPSGEQTVELVKAEPMVAKDNSNNRYNKCQFKICDGEYKGRILFHNFNLVNDSEQAMEIALNDLKQFMHAAKVLTLKKGMFNLSQLLNIPVRVRIGVKKGNEGYDDQNVIKMFLMDEVPVPGGKDKKKKKKDKAEETPAEDTKSEKKGKKDKSGKKGKKAKDEDVPF